MDFLKEIKLNFFVVMFHFKHCDFFTLSQVIYSFSFLFSFCIVWVAFNMQLREGSWAYGVLGGSAAVLAACFIETVVLHRLQLYIKHSESKEYSMHEIMMKKPQPETSIEKRLLGRKQKYQKATLILSLVCPIIFIVPVLVVGGADDVSIGAAFTVGVVGFLGGLITIMLLELKSVLRQFGRIVMSFLLSCCWLFIWIPTLALIPVTLAVLDESERSSLTSWSIGFACVLIMGSVSATSIAINILFRRMEYEKLAKYCVLRVQRRLRQIAVRSHVDILREIFDQLYASNPESIKAVLEDGTYIYYFDIPDNDPDLKVSKEILTIKDLAKKNRSSVKGVDVVEVDEEDVHENKTSLSCMKAILAICSDSTEESDKVMNGDEEELLDFDNLQDLDISEIMQEQGTAEKAQVFSPQIDLQSDNENIQSPPANITRRPLSIMDLIQQHSHEIASDQQRPRKVRNIFMAFAEKERIGSSNEPSSLSSELMKSLVEFRVAEQTRKFNQLLADIMMRNPDEPEVDNEDIDAKEVDQSTRQRLLK